MSAKKAVLVSTPTQPDYPPNYLPWSLSRQVAKLAKIFSLSTDETNKFIREDLPNLALPEFAEAWFAVPSEEALARNYFTDISDPAERHSSALLLVTEKLSEVFGKKFYDYRKGKFDPAYLQQAERTTKMIGQIAATQKGDILIIAAQFGSLHADKPIDQVRRILRRQEFNLDAVMVGSMLLTHPERLQDFQNLFINCGGEEYAEEGDGAFNDALCYRYHDDRIELVSRSSYREDGGYGNATGFIPEMKRPASRRTC